MYLVASVRPSFCPSVTTRTAEPLDLWVQQRAKNSHYISPGCLSVCQIIARPPNGESVFQCDPWILLGGITSLLPQNMCHTHSWPQQSPPPVVNDMSLKWISWSKSCQSPPPVILAEGRHMTGVTQVKRHLLSKAEVYKLAILCQKQVCGYYHKKLKSIHHTIIYPANEVRLME